MSATVKNYRNDNTNPSLFTKVVKTLWGAVESYKRYYRAMIELESMSNRELAELGIYRGMISDVASSKHVVESRKPAVDLSLNPTIVGEAESASAANTNNSDKQHLAA
ncbi:MAG: DUF1127 domain-containing protein [Rhodospirillales bacterium]|jgi:uncharacterized protein YjiS (DUF1127 family)|nr:DUF1127 domain-containing protein [Rhodospirillales bacterium]